jgi:hexosaminidase
VSYVANIISEFASVVSDSFFHLGGDEVNMNCWSQAPTIKAYLSTHQNSSVHQLQQQYVNAIAQQALAANKTPVFWEDSLLQPVAMGGSLSLPSNSVINVWLGQQSVINATNMGYRVVASPYQFMYLDCGFGEFLTNDPAESWCPYVTWGDVYAYDPRVNVTNSTAAQLVLGGEADLWGELVDDSIVAQKLWPRASAAAESFWSGPQNATGANRTMAEAASRLVTLRSRLQSMNIGSQPLGPFLCNYDVQWCFL